MPSFVLLKQIQHIWLAEGCLWHLLPRQNMPWKYVLTVGMILLIQHHKQMHSVLFYQLQLQQLSWQQRCLQDRSDVNLTLFQISSSCFCTKMVGKNSECPILAIPNFFQFFFFFFFSFCTKMVKKIWNAQFWPFLNFFQSFWYQNG